MMTVAQRYGMIVIAIIELLGARLEAEGAQGRHGGRTGKQPLTNGLSVNGMSGTRDEA
jgi:hypothetical protein